MAVDLERRTQVSPDVIRFPLRPLAILLTMIDILFLIKAFQLYFLYKTDCEVPVLDLLYNWAEYC